jgi:hypothetical protein
MADAAVPIAPVAAAPPAAPVEQWRVVENKPTYEVSDLGQVRNVRTGRILKPISNRKGYQWLMLAGNCLLVSRLVAAAFIPNPENKPEVDHSNRDNTDNRARNLRWCTHQENMLNRVRKPRALPRGVYHSLNKFQAQIAINNRTTCIGTYATVEEAHAAYCARAAELPGAEFRRFD